LVFQNVILINRLPAEKYIAFAYLARGGGSKAGQPNAQEQGYDYQPQGYFAQARNFFERLRH
jgi:hypothetical protein